MKQRLLIVTAMVAFMASGAMADGRVTVQPVFFVPSDSASITKNELGKYSDLLSAHLRLAREHWRRILGPDTFEVSREGSRVYQALNPDAYYVVPGPGKGPDTAHRMLKELFVKYGDNRDKSRFIYLVIYVRPPGAMRGDALGGGRTMNGRPGTGGGFTHLELSSLLTDSPYPFQSTLVHELGHTFGLAHSDCYGYSLTANDSVMSYNPKHHTKGLPGAPGLGGLNPEEYYAIALNRLVFPNFVFTQAVHNPQHKNLDKATERCFLGEMNSYIGAITQRQSVGYELLFNGQRVNGDDAQFYTRAEAEANCRQNTATRPGTRVECRFDGKPILPAGVRRP